MRLAIGRISDGELEFAQRICRFVRDIYRELTLVVPYMDDSSDMKTKMDTMLQSVMKIENGNVLAVSLPELCFHDQSLLLFVVRFLEILNGVTNKIIWKLIGKEIIYPLFLFEKFYDQDEDKIMDGSCRPIVMQMGFLA